jgi:glyoxylase-like metal-dependent hydrolase (beta-lactamase superfamily II)
MGLACLRDLPGLPQEVVIVPLPGHTPGHCGVAIRAENRWHLHAGDAYFDARELDADPQCRLGLKVYEWATESDRRRRIETQRKLRALHAAHPDIIMSCTHDVREFERLAGRPAHLPADQINALPRNEYSEKIVRARPVPTPSPPPRPAAAAAEGFDRELRIPRKEAPPQPRH